jgi:branched-chain amino acid transport system permease protein
LSALRRVWSALATPGGKLGLGLLAAGVLGGLPLGGLEPSAIRLLFITLVWTTTSLGWNLLGGLAGQVSFGFAVFFGLGAYSAALLINAGVSPYAAFVAAAAVGALASVAIGLPTFRMRGPYFTIATIGVTEAVRVVMSNLELTGGASGMRVTEHGPFRQLEHYYTALVVTALALSVSIVLSKSRFGLALRAIKQDEDAAADLGVGVYACKLEVHALAAALTALAGGVFARHAAFIHPQGVFSFDTSISILLMPIIGGIGTTSGAVLGGIVFGIVEEELVVNFPDLHLLVYGAVLMLIVLVEPGGLAGLFTRMVRACVDSGSKWLDQVFWRRGRAQ